jgi:hypothetical protein
MVPEEVQTYRQTLGRIYRRKLMARIAKGEKRKPVLYELSQVMAKEHPHAHLKPETAKRYIESPQSRPGRKRRGATT